MRNKRPKNMSLSEAAHGILDPIDASRYVDSVVVANRALMTVCEAVLAVHGNGIDKAVDYAASVVKQVPAITPDGLATTLGNTEWDENVLFSVWFVARERAFGGENKKGKK